MQSTNQIINPYCQSTYAMRVDYEPKAADSCRMKEIFTCCRHVLNLTSINIKQTLKGLMQDRMLANSKPRRATNQESRRVIPSKVEQSWTSIKSMNKLTYHEVQEHKLSNPTKPRSWIVIPAARKLQHACNPAVMYGKISLHMYGTTINLIVG